MRPPNAPPRQIETNAKMRATRDGRADNLADDEEFAR
jgi:hypothetical protein